MSDAEGAPTTMRRKPGRPGEFQMTAFKAILAGTIYTPLEEIKNGVILIDGHRITRVGLQGQIKIPAGSTIIDNQDRIVVPGFIDLHIHGAVGHDLMEATPGSVSAVGAYLARHGTTAYLATTVTASVPRTLNSTRKLGEIIRASRTMQEHKSVGAQPVGIHFEGPFLSRSRRGAQPEAHIRKPSKETLGRMIDASGETARVMTLAPELDGAPELLDYARGRGLRVGLGHSDATYEEAERAIDAGATHAIHTYNAMRPFGHRDPGILGAVLTDDRLSAEVIADGVHVDPPAVRLLLKSKGMERVILVSDSVSGAGMPDGHYRLGGMNIRVAGGVCRTDEGNLAGSSLTLDAALRNFASFTLSDVPACLRCATLNPAKILGIEKQKGAIAPGADADLAVLDRNYYVTQTYVRGLAAL